MAGLIFCCMNFIIFLTIYYVIFLQVRGLETTPKCKRSYSKTGVLPISWIQLETFHATPYETDIGISCKLPFCLLEQRPWVKFMLDLAYVFGLLSKRKLTLGSQYSWIWDSCPASHYPVLWIGWLIMQHSLKATCSAFLAMLIWILLLYLDWMVKKFKLAQWKGVGLGGGALFTKHEASPWSAGNIPLILVHLLSLASFAAPGSLFSCYLASLCRFYKVSITPPQPPLW